MASAHSRRLLTLSIAAAMLLSLSLFSFFFRVRHTLEQASQDAGNAHRLAFAFSPLAAVPNPGFEPIAAPAAFNSVAMLDGHIFLAGDGGLEMYSASGVLERSFRVGNELPPAALGNMVAARLRGQSDVRLVIATAGAGVLVFDPATRTFAQLLPAAPALRDVTALASFASGELLVGTRRGGLLSFDGNLLTQYRPEYAGASITSLLAVGNDVWAGMQDQGVLHTHAGVTDRFLSELPDAHVAALAGDGSRIFAATPLGVEMFEDGRPARLLAAGTFAQALFAERVIGKLAGEAHRSPHHHRHAARIDAGAGEQIS